MKRRFTSFLALACLFLLPPRLHAQEWVKFPGTIEDGQARELSGILTVPKGDGPFPAVVLLPVCNGLRAPATAAQMTGWARRLSEWGYVTLQVDSLGPRSLGACRTERVRLGGRGRRRQTSVSRDTVIVVPCLFRDSRTPH